MVKRKKEKRLILYRKYLHDNHLDTEVEPVKVPLQEKRTSPIKHICDFILMLIIISMIGLAIVGVVTLMHPQLREMFLRVVGM